MTDLNQLDKSFDRHILIKQHINNGFVILIGQAFSAIGGLIGLRILTEYLAPAQYGELAIGLSVVLVINQVLTGPLSAGITRFYSISLEKGEITEFFSVVIDLTRLTFMIIVLMTVLVVAIMWGIDAKEWISIVIIASLFSIVSGLNAFINSIWLAKNNQIALSVNQGLEPWFRIGGGILCIVLIGANGQIAFSGFVIGCVALLFCQIYSLNNHRILLQNFYLDWRNLKRRSTSKLPREILNYSYPFALWGIVTAVHVASDRWILNYYYGNEMVGYFAVLYQIGYAPMLLLAGIFSQLFTPIFFKLASDQNASQENNINHFSQTFIYAALIFVVLTTLISWLLSENIFRLLTADYYKAVHGYLPLFVFAGGIFGIGQIAVLKLQSQLRTLALLKIKLTVAILGMTLNILLIPIYDVAGAAVSLIIFSIAYLIWIIVDIQKNKPIN